jgi:hypothetical protein
MHFNREMAASTRLSAAEVARVLNRFGASSADMTDDLSDMILDYFGSGNQDHASSDTDSGDDVEGCDVPAVILMSSSVQSLQQPAEQDESYSAPFIRMPSNDPELVTLGDNDSDIDGKVNLLFEKGCGCSHNCVGKFSKEMIQQSIFDCIENDMYCSHHVNHQHLILLGAMNAVVHNQTVTIQKDHKSQNRKESRSTFMFQGIGSLPEIFFSCFWMRRKKTEKREKAISV